MNDISQDDPEERQSRGRTNQFLTLALGAVSAIIVAVAMNTGGTIITGDKNSAVLTSQVQQIVEQNKDQNIEIKGQSKLLQDLLMKMGDLYTRREAQADREAADRRFQGVESRIGDLGQRLEALEMRRLLDKGAAARH